MQPTDQKTVLLRKAQEDEYVLRRLADDPQVPDAILGFHAQQAVEKLLKAVLASHGIAYPFTHDLMALLELLSSQGLTCPVDVAELIRLTPFAARARYDDPVPMSGRFDRAQVLALVATVRSWTITVT